MNIPNRIKNWPLRPFGIIIIFDMTALRMAIRASLVGLMTLGALGPLAAGSACQQQKATCPHKVCCQDKLLHKQSFQEFSNKLTSDCLCARSLTMAATERQPTVEDRPMAKPFGATITSLALAVDDSRESLSAPFPLVSLNASRSIFIIHRSLLL